ASSRKQRASSAASGGRSGGHSRVLTAPTRGAFAITASPTVALSNRSAAMAPSCHARGESASLDGWRALPPVGSGTRVLVAAEGPPRQAGDRKGGAPAGG